MDRRTKPSIIITGTPGTGKSSLAGVLAEETGAVHIDVGKVVKEQHLHDGYDEEYDSFIFNEEKVLEELEDKIRGGNVIVDHHGCDYFPDDWFDLVVVLRTTTEALYDRLIKRNYSKLKLDENVECEIMQVVLEEATDHFLDTKVIVLDSNTVDDMTVNTEKLKLWMSQWTSK